jgi:membrane protein DedA with SNARE-associated domain
VTLESFGPFVYLAVFVLAIVEGEVGYVAAATLVAHGRLDATAVMVAGASGAAFGDQMYFYVLRGRLTRWLDRFPRIARKAAPLVARVRRHRVPMVLMLRFSPGLRVAIAAACAYANVPPLLFSVLNGITAVFWAMGVMALVAWVGPTYLASFGLSGWKGALLMGVVVVVLFKIFGRFEQKTIAQSGGSTGTGPTGGSKGTRPTGSLEP